jgi:hypothetical protein
MCSVAALVSTWATVAAADPPQLKGEYAFTGSFACLVAPGTGPAGMPHPNAGFNPNLTPVDGGAFSNSASTEGIYTLDGHGNGTVKSTIISINPPPPANAILATNSYSITYSVNTDGSWKADLVPGSLLSTFLAGPRTGQTSTLDKLSQVGLVGDGANVLTLASIEPEIETQTFSNGDV